MKDLKELPLDLRDDNGQRDDSPDGVYHIPHNTIDRYIYNVVFSIGMGWEHMSVSLLKINGKNKIEKVERCPTWEEMCFLKNVFWTPEECCVQYHPAMADYISNHKWCLHVWRSTEVQMPVPDTVLVGLKDLDKILAWLNEQYPNLPLERIEVSRILYYADASELVIGDEKSEKTFKARVDAHLRSNFGIVKKK